MKKLFAVLILLVSIQFSSHAVLKENGLGRTLSVLRAELKYVCEQQQLQLDAYELQVEKLHQQLIGYMTRSEQVGLMLYSNNMTNSFGVAYSCSEAGKLRDKLHGEHGGMASYIYARNMTRMDIEKYRSLVRTLKNIPPVDTDDEDHIMTAGDSLLFMALDSLKHHMTESYDNISETSMKLVSLMKGNIPEQNEPLVLTGDMLDDRAACVEYAQVILDNLEKYKESLEKDNMYYEGVKGKVEELHDFADSCYVILQNHIYYTFDSNPLNLLSNYEHTKDELIRSWHNNFSDLQELFKGEDDEPVQSKNKSDWRGYQLLYLSVFFILYLIAGRILSSIVLRFIFREKIKKDKTYLHKIYVLQIIVTYFLMILVAFGIYMVKAWDNHMVQYSMPLIINYLWVALAVTLSLYAGLEGKKMEEMVKTFSPFLNLSFVVVLMRMTLCPDIWINTIFPPIILVCTLISLYRCIKFRHNLSIIDSVLIWYTAFTMAFGTFLAMVGASLYSMLEIYWWCIQLGCIMTIRWLHSVVGTKIRVVQKNEWLNMLFNKCIIPILFVWSIPYCLYLSSDIFALRPYCDTVFHTDYINEEGLMQVSLIKVFKVTIMWFIFRYIANVCRWVYEKYTTSVTKASKGNANVALVRNAIAIVVWGIYAIVFLVIMNVPRSGISIVSAGLATGLGFAMKGLIENFVCGLYLMTGRLRVGDKIECDGITGTVDSISYQNTQIATYDGSVVSFLNSDLFNKNFKNLTRNHSFVRESINVGVAYGSDVALVRDVIYNAVQGLADIPGSNDKPLCDFKRYPASVLFVDFGSSSLDFEVRIWTRVNDRVKMKTEARNLIYNAFKENNISIPFPQRDVHIIKD